MTAAIGNRVIRRGALSGLVAIAALLATAGAAPATYDPVGSGATVLRLSGGFSKLLKDNGVQLKSFKPGTVKGKSVTIPLSTGKLDPTTSEGTLDHAGGFAFKAGGKQVLIKSLILKTTQKRSPLSAKVGGGQLKLATTTGVKFTRDGFGSVVKTGTLKMSSKLAARLNKKLKLKNVFDTGQVMGVSTTTFEPQTTAVLSGPVRIEPNPETFSKLNKLSVAVNPIFPAEHSSGGFAMPAIGGTIAPDGGSGEVRFGGSLELLQIGGGQLIWKELWPELAAKTVSADVEFGPSPPRPGKLGRVGLFDLGLSGAAASDPSARTVTVSGGVLTMQVATATAMNEAFAKGEPAFKAGDVFGTLSFTAQGQ